MLKTVAVYMSFAIALAASYGIWMLSNSEDDEMVESESPENDTEWKKDWFDGRTEQDGEIVVRTAHIRGELIEVGSGNERHWMVPSETRLMHWDPNDETYSSKLCSLNPKGHIWFEGVNGDYVQLRYQSFDLVRLHNECRNGLEFMLPRAITPSSVRPARIVDESPQSVDRCTPLDFCTSAGCCIEDFVRLQQAQAQDPQLEAKREDSSANAAAQDPRRANENWSGRGYGTTILY
ncbi:MAG: hypothetical protein ABIG71_00960 [Candidatus Uhrbacteria bacterium]